MIIKMTTIYEYVIMTKRKRSILDAILVIFSCINRYLSWLLRFVVVLEMDFGFGGIIVDVG